MSEKAVKRIQREKVQLLLKHPFFGHLIISFGDPVEAPECPTIATDGRSLFYNPAFVESLPADVLQGVLVHEVLHCALRHLWRKQNREFMRFNIAADLAVNPLVIADGLKLPADSLLDERFADMSAEEIYTKLPESTQEKWEKGAVIDDHSRWGKDADSGSEKSDSDAESDSSGGDSSEESKKVSDSSGEGQKVFASSLEQEWREKVAQAANAARTQGIFPASLEKLVQDVLEPVLDWKTILRDLVQSAVKSNHRLIPPSKKHLWRGMYLPSLKGESLEIAVAVDTSGSISDEELEEFFAELRGIASQYQDYTIYLYTCDAKVQDFWELTPYDGWPQFKVHGRGGTDFRPVFRDIEQKQMEIAALLYFTDAFGTFPDSPPPYPVVWVLTTGTPTPWGDRVEIPRDKNGRR